MRDLNEALKLSVTNEYSRCCFITMLNLKVSKFMGKRELNFLGIVFKRDILISSDFSNFE